MGTNDVIETWKTLGAVVKEKPFTSDTGPEDLSLMT